MWVASQTCTSTKVGYQPAPFARTQMRMWKLWKLSLTEPAGRTHLPRLCFVFVACAQLSMSADPEASIALPFTPRPIMLTGELVGDVGFDPLNFSEEVSKFVIVLPGRVLV